MFGTCVEAKIKGSYLPEDTDSGVVPDSKADEALRKLIGRDFDIVRKFTFGDRIVGWAGTEKEAARIIRIFVKHRLRYFTSISNPEYQLQLSRFLKRHHISPEPYAPSSLKDVINAEK
jgi:hypothetical protein